MRAFFVAPASRRRFCDVGKEEKSPAGRRHHEETPR